MAKCQRCVGFHVQLKLHLGEDAGSGSGAAGAAAGAITLQGIVYAVHNGLLVLQEPSGIRLVDIEALDRFQVLNEKDGTAGKCKIADLEPPPFADAEVVQKKLEEARAKRQQMLSNRNASASALAQRIFDDLQKT